MTSTEERMFFEQIEIAKEYQLPILIHTPQRQTRRNQRSLTSSKKAHRPQYGAHRHNNEMTIPWVKDTGCHAGLHLPDTKMSPERMVNIFRILERIK